MIDKQVSFKEIKLPRLNGLDKVTLESTLIKLTEEMGELAQYIGKCRGLSGESVALAEDVVMKGITAELLDVAQTAITMMYVLEENFDIDVQAAVKEHVEKLLKKGYIK